MYVFSNSSVNAAVLNSIANFNIQSRITGTVNGISFTDANIVAGSFSITNQCSSETELSIGQVYVGELNITLTGLNIDRYTLYGTRIIPTWGIYVNSAWRNVPLGIFIISEVEVVSLGLKIRAYDNMSLLDVPFTSSVMGGTPHGIAQGICRDLGLTLGTSQSTFATFPNYNVTLSATQTTDYEGNKSIPQFSTYRDVIACVAQVTCTNVTIDRSGQLIFVPYPSTAVASIDTSHRKMDGMTADFETYYDGIIVTDPATKAQTKYTRSNPSGLTMDLGDNPFINTAAIRNAILNALTFRFHPFRMDILNAPLYDLMDCINLPDGIGDGTKLYCITKYTWTYHGSYQLVGAGQDPKLVAVASAAQRSAAQANFIAAQKVTTDEMDAAIDAATAQITGNNGGYVVLHDSDNDDQPDELLVMNTPSINTATKVWRFNLSGLGHSNNGYSGTYGLALTADGNIVANRVVVGTLGDQAGLNYWNMETGDFQIKALSEYGWNPQVGVLQTYAGEDIQTYAGENIQAYSPATYSLIQTNADGIRLVSENAAHLQSELNLVPGQITAAVSALEGQIGAELALEIATDSGGHPYGKISANADYISFNTGDLVINSSGFKLDANGNAQFNGAVTATSLTLGSGVTVPSGKVSGLATVATSGAYGDLTSKPDLTVYVKKGVPIGRTPAEGATGFKVESSGALTASNAIIWGTIYATNGVFSGTVSGSTITGSTFTSSNGKLVISSDSILLRNGETTAESTTRISITAGSSPTIQFYYRSTTNDSWLEGASIYSDPTYKYTRMEGLNSLRVTTSISVSNASGYVLSPKYQLSQPIDDSSAYTYDFAFYDGGRVIWADKFRFGGTSQTSLVDASQVLIAD